MADSPSECHVMMLADDSLREFWEFATTVRRTKSLAERESAKLRGTWITPNLAVQRIHGWGPRAVRLLCVRAHSREAAADLQRFFDKDRHNLEGFISRAMDPLDRQERVLVKVPYDASLAGSVAHERALLTDLAGLEGVPELLDPLYFEDISVPAVTYRFNSSPNLQDQLETRGLLPQEDLHKLLAFVLRTLEQAQERGWIHCDLQPRDVLLSSGGGLLCGWSRGTATSSSPDLTPGLSELVRQLPVAVPRPPRRGPSAAARRLLPPDLIPEGPVETPVARSACWFGGGQEMGGPSLLSAPEQFLSLFAGSAHEAPATDVYRAAAVALLAVRARGPLGSRLEPMDPAVERAVGELRGLCHEALRRRAEWSGSELVLPPAGEASQFATALEELVAGALDVAGCGSPELEPWFRRCLAREPRDRYQTATEALEALNEAWSVLEERLLLERRAEKENVCAEVPKTRVREPIVLEKPPELADMDVL